MDDGLSVKTESEMAGQRKMTSSQAVVVPEDEESTT